MSLQERAAIPVACAMRTDRSALHYVCREAPQRSTSHTRSANNSEILQPVPISSKLHDQPSISFFAFSRPRTCLPEKIMITDESNSSHPEEQPGIGGLLSSLVTTGRGKILAPPEVGSPL